MVVPDKGVGDAEWTDISAAMDHARAFGVSATRYLQSRYGGGGGGSSSSFFLWVSRAADRRHAFSVLFPPLFQLRAAAGVRLIWAAAVGDWLNLLLKWLLFEGRPYWWVHETRYYADNSAAPPRLEQYPVTCEMGPGSPSGHAMGAASVYYTLVTSVLAVAATDERPATKKRRRCLKVVLWAAFWAIQVCVGLSRVFVAAHFPHQVALGVAAGAAVAHAFDPRRARWIHAAGLGTYLAAVLFMAAATVAPYWLCRELLGVDLVRTTAEKARRWCARPEWVQEASCPFAVLARATGALLGLGLGLRASPLYTHAAEPDRSAAPVKALCVAVSVAALRLLDVAWASVRVGGPADDAARFYLLCFCRSAAAPLVTVGVVPYLVHSAVLLAVLYVAVAVHTVRYFLGW